MKKILSTASFIFITIAILNMLSFPAAAASIQNLTAAVNSSTGYVTVNGRVDSGTAQGISIRVFDPKGTPDYVDAITSNADGTFSFTFKPSSTETGTFSVTVNGGLGDTPGNTTFVMGSGSSNPNYSNLQASIETQSKRVTISGKISSTGIEKVAVKVIDPQGGVDYVDQTISGSDGSFSFSYYTNSIVGGNYMVQLGGTADNLSTQTSFVYNAPATPGFTNLQVEYNSSNSIVTISGKIDAGANKNVNMKILDPKGGLEGVNQITSDANGEFSLSVAIQNPQSGAYDVQVGGDGVANPLHFSFYCNQVDQCFIATAAFGSKFTPAVTLLRQFRDEFLMTNGPGRTFVEFYYHNSPPLAAYIADHEILKVIVRILLFPVIIMVYALFHPLWLFPLASLIIVLMAVKRKKLVPGI